MWLLNKTLFSRKCVRYNWISEYWPVWCSPYTWVSPCSLVSCYPPGDLVIPGAWCSFGWCIFHRAISNRDVQALEGANKGSTLAACWCWDLNLTILLSTPSLDCWAQMLMCLISEHFFQDHLCEYSTTLLFNLLNLHFYKGSKLWPDCQSMQGVWESRRVALEPWLEPRLALFGRPFSEDTSCWYELKDTAPKKGQELAFGDFVVQRKRWVQCGLCRLGASPQVIW